MCLVSSIPMGLYFDTIVDGTQCVVNGRKCKKNNKNEESRKRTNMKYVLKISYRIK